MIVAPPLRSFHFSLVTASALLFAVGSGCRAEDDETVIKRHIRAALEASEEKHPTGVLERVADDFKTTKGLTRDEIQRVLIGRLLRKQWVVAFERSLDVIVDGHTATADLRVVVAQGDQIKSIEDLAPTEADALRFDLKLEKRADGWWIVEASYKKDG